MERRNVPLNDPHHSTANLLSWSEIRQPDSSSAANPSNQPSDGISEVLDGCKITNEETQALNKNVSYRKNCSGHKLKEMSGSDLFSDNGKDEPSHKTINHYHQDQHNQLSFNGEENVSLSPKKPTVLTETPKQKELNKNVQTESDSKSKKKQILKDNKSKGHDIFASPPEAQPRRFLTATEREVKGNKNIAESAPRNIKASGGKGGERLFSQQNVVKSSKKSGKLTSNGIFKSDKISPGYSEKMHSSAKLREMSGNNIFADGKSEYRDYYGGTRRPPGGESSISLV